MNLDAYPTPAPAAPRRQPRRVLRGLLVVALILAVSGGLWLSRSAWLPGSKGTPGQSVAEPAPIEQVSIPPVKPVVKAGVADGFLDKDETLSPSEMKHPAVAKLDPALRKALQKAAKRASEAGIEIRVNSGWRSRAYQQQIFNAAVLEYGSKRQAAKWVSTPAKSKHVSGKAVDIAPPAAAKWLNANGAVYGLCRIYQNEPWHFELRPSAAKRGCPKLFIDASRRN